MKKVTFVLVALLLTTGSYAQEQVATANIPRKPVTGAGFSWADTSFDFGKTKAGIPVTYEFRFTNTGMSPLVIVSAKASCGCTTTTYTKEPVEKGGSGFVRVTYDASKQGIYSKTVAVNANTAEGVVQLTIKGEVE